MTPSSEAQGAETKQHGPLAGYSGGPGKPYYQPFIDCLCGWSSGRVETFQFAGELFDEHITEVDKFKVKANG